MSDIKVKETLNKWQVYISSKDNKKFRLIGIIGNGLLQTTSEIVKIENGYAYTKSGSVYRLGIPLNNYANAYNKYVELKKQYLATPHCNDYLNK